MIRRWVRSIGKKEKKSGSHQKKALGNATASESCTMHWGFTPLSKDTHTTISWRGVHHSRTMHWESRTMHWNFNPLSKDTHMAASWRGAHHSRTMHWGFTPLSKDTHTDASWRREHHSHVMHWGSHTMHWNFTPLSKDTHTVASWRGAHHSSAMHWGSRTMHWEPVAPLLWRKIQDISPRKGDSLTWLPLWEAYSLRTYPAW